MSKIKTVDQFLTACRNAAVVWFNKQKFSAPFIAHNDVKLVWEVKCLQNFKACMSVLSSPWGIPNILYEFNYNGDKNELYMDVYQKQYNDCFNVVVTDDYGTEQA